MALQIRPSKGIKLSNLLGAALVVLALVAQPLYGLASGEVANATNSGDITTEQQLRAAAADRSVTVLSIRANISVSSKINLSGRSVYIDGNGNTLTFTGDAAGWQGNYIFQAYRNTLTVKNLNFTGGDAALFANGATLNLEGNVNVSGNEFGGIEVSNNGARLNVGSANLTNATEAYATPTAWIDQASTSNAVVNGAFTEAAYVKPDQKQYYLNPSNALAAPQLVSPANNAVVKGASVVNSWNEVSGATRYIYESYNNETATNVRWTQSINGTSKSATNVSEVTFWWRVKAVDAAGNQGAWSPLWKVTVDDTPPTIENPSVDRSVTNAATVKVSGTVNDANLKSYDLRVYKGDKSAVVSPWTGMTGTANVSNGLLGELNIATLADGDYFVRVWATDKANNSTGNTGSTTFYIPFTIDRSAPSAPTITAPAVNQEFPGVAGKIRAEWNASNDERGIALYQIEYVYSRNGKTVTDYREVSGDQLYRDQILSGTTVSDFTIRVRAQDTAGNWSAWSESVTYYYGVAAPTITTPPVEEEENKTPTVLLPDGPISQQERESGVSALGGTTQGTGGTFGNVSIFTTPASEEDDDQADNTGILGAQTERVSGPATQAAIAESTPGGWKIFGLMWYWWLLILAAIVGAWSLIAAARRRKEDEAVA